MKTFDPNTLNDSLNITHKVRVVTLDGKPWFVAADVCRVLGLKRGPDGSFRQHLRKLSDDEKRRHPVHQIEGRAPSIFMIVSEPGLYKLIMRSDKPTARPFQDWVTREVLPSIRKTGGYRMQPGEMVPVPSSFADALRHQASTLIDIADRLANGEPG